MSNPVDSFVIENGVMDVEEYTNSPKDHSSFCNDFSIGVVDGREFLEQLKFQSDLLNSCEQTVERLTTDNTEPSTEVLEILSTRIHKMYMLWFEKLGTDVMMITDYIKFGSKNKIILSEFRKSLDKLMDFFQMDPDVYLIAANCVFNDFNDVQSARKYLENGITHHNNYQKLFEEDFRLEVEVLKSTKGASFPETLKKYERIIENFKDDIILHFDLLEHALDVFWIREFPRIVVKDLVNKYKQSELMWQKLAKTQLKGFIYNFESDYMYQCNDDLNCINNCIITYEKGLQENWTPMGKQILWDLFLDEIVEISDSDRMKNKIVENFFTDEIARIFNQAHANKTLFIAERYIFWAEHSQKDEELSILKESVNVLRDNQSLWCELLGYYLSKDYFQRGWSAFQNGVDALQERSEPLWAMMNLYVLNTDDITIQQFYEKASHSEYENISMEYRPKFLEWTFMRLGLNSSRKLFHELKLLQPSCKQLYMSMIQFENLSYIDGKRSLKLVRDLFSETCNLYGHDDVDLWNKCMQFEYKYGKVSFVDIIYSAALQILEPDLITVIEEVRNDLERQFKNDSSDETNEEIIEIDD